MVPMFFFLWKCLVCIVEEHETDRELPVRISYTFSTRHWSFEGRRYGIGVNGLPRNSNKQSRAEYSIFVRSGQLMLCKFLKSTIIRCSTLICCQKKTEKID